MMLVAQAMNRAPVTVPPDALVCDAADLARRTGADHLLVLDEDTLVGILCACDLREADPEEPVSEAMSVPVLTVRPDANIEEVALAMGECDVGCLPVALGGLVLGTVSDAELERAGVPAHHVHAPCHHRQARRLAD
jgi:CBS domain-containing protein